MKFEEELEETIKTAAAAQLGQAPKKDHEVYRGGFLWGAGWARSFTLNECAEKVRMAKSEVYEEAAKTFMECGETAVSLAYRDKAAELRGKKNGD